MAEKLLKGLPENIAEWTPLHAGELIVFTAGACSDYSVLMIARVVHDFDMAARLRSYLERYPEQAAAYKFNNAQFIGQELLEDLEPLTFRQAHTEDYGCSDRGFLAAELPRVPRLMRFNREHGDFEDAHEDSDAEWQFPVSGT